MSSWQISIPFAQRSEPLSVTAGRCRETRLGQEAPVMQELVLQARLDGLAETAGGLLDALEGMSAQQRRALIDKARAELGLGSTEMVDVGRRIQSATRPFALTKCAASGCTAVPVGAGGVFLAPNVQRWWCERHRHLAEPGDDRPRRLPIRRAPSGALIPDDGDEKREAAAAATRRAEVAARDAEAQAEAVALERHAQARRAQIERELPGQMRGVR